MCPEGESNKPTPAQALRALELQEARWQAILDTARDAILGIDLTGRVTLFNHAAEEIFGYAAAEVLGQNVTLLMPTPTARSTMRTSRPTAPRAFRRWPSRR